MLDLLRRIAAGEQQGYDLSKLADYIETVKVNPCGLRFRDGYCTMKGQQHSNPNTRWYLIEEGGVVSEPMTLEQVQVKLLTERSPF